MSRDGYLPDGVTESDIERHFGTLSPADANEIQRRLEEKAEDEWRHNSPAFQDWLCGQELLDVAGLAIAWDRGVEDAGYYLSKIAARLFSDWVQYRVNSFPEDVVKQVQDDVMGVEA